MGSRVRFWQQHAFRARLDVATAVAGVVLALTGAWLGLRPASIPVALDRAGYHLGDKVVPAAGPGAYDGDTALVVHDEGGELRAAAAGRFNGLPMQGLCVFVVGTEVEQCIFVVGRTSFHAEDRLVGASWRRRYDDGHEVVLPLARGRPPVPVPVPLGWQ